MRILFVASEAVPYHKSGGLADVARALPDALLRDGHDVRICHPFYGFIEGRNLQFTESSEQPVPWRGQGTVRFHRHERPGGADGVLVDHPLLRVALDPYGSPGDPLAVGERFALFSRAALHYARSWGAELMHLNDWQTGLVPVYALADDIPMATVFSIHNLPYQGIFPFSILDRIGVPRYFFRTENGLEFFGNVSFIKGGIALADRVTTVSPTYAREIQTPVYGAGMDGLLRFRARDLHGILNGLDVESWNPMTDQALAEPYSLRTAQKKEANRSALLQELQLDGSGPLIVSVTRLAHQKGIDILLAALPRLIELGAAVALLGDGDSALEQAFARAARQYPGKVAAVFKFDDALSRRLYAGGDFFVMPSRYEPCGLGQMIAQRYGAVPIVRHTGGLVDTVQDGDTGFVFGPASPEALVDAARRACAVWGTRGWTAFRRRCMRIDHSWGRSAEKYEQVYRAAIGPALS